MEDYKPFSLEFISFTLEALSAEVGRLVDEIRRLSDEVEEIKYGRGIEDNIEIPPKLRKKSGRPRLLPHQVEEIRKEEFSAKEYGEMYGVGTGCIYKIWRGER